jgi:O-antigen/teichoic acid export membrane protein
MALRAASLIGRLVLMLSVAKILSPAELGSFGVIVASLGFSTLIIGMEFYAYSMREIMSASSERRVSMLRDKLVLFACVYVFLGGLSAVFAMFEVLPARLNLWLLALMVADHLSQESTRALIALGRPIAANLVLFVRVAAWVFGWLWYVLVFPSSAGLNAVLAWWLIGALASLMIVVRVLWEMPWPHASRQPVDWAWIRKGFRTARPFMLTALSALGLSYADRYVLNAFSGASSVGALTLYSGLASAAHNVVNAGVAMISLPKLVRAWNARDHLRYKAEIRRLWLSTLIWISFIAILASALIQPIVRWIDQPEYIQGLSAYYLIVFAAVVRCAADVPIYILYAQNKDKALLWINLAAFVASFSANLLLVPRIGLLGCGVGAVVGTLVLLSVAMIAMRREDRIS